MVLYTPLLYLNPILIAPCVYLLYIIWFWTLVKQSIMNIFMISIKILYILASIYDFTEMLWGIF